MKNLIFIILFGGWAVIAKAQLVKDPVSWSFSSKKIGHQTYRVYMRAKIQGGWHIYAQMQPEGAISLPTSLRFIGEKGIIIIGKPAEVGNKKTQQVEDIGIKQFYYDGQVDFIQNIKVTRKGPVSINCQITYMACDDNQCLPVEEKSFLIPLPN